MSSCGGNWARFEGGRLGQERRTSVRLFCLDLNLNYCNAPSIGKPSRAFAPGAVMPHTHHTTLISATNLVERLAAAPRTVLIVDCRFDFAAARARQGAYASR